MARVVVAAKAAIDARNPHTLSPFVHEQRH
jgi:hypothetical protein